MNRIAAPAYENIGEMVEEIRHLRELLKEGAAEIQRQQAVVDAAWTQRKYHDPECLCVVCLALADLDGEVKP